MSDDDVEKDNAPSRSESPASDRVNAFARGFRWGIEAHGTVPVPYEDRNDTQFYKVFFVWFSMNFNILSFSTGTLGPVVFGLGLRDSCLVILFFNLLAHIIPAYLNTWGPKTGMRQMIISRYSFGYHGVIIITIHNLISLCGFNVLNCILGGQALASVSNNKVSCTKVAHIFLASVQLTLPVGIVIIANISMIVSFMGYKVLNWYERFSWPPVLLAFLVALGVGGKNFYNIQPAEPATAAAILSFAATITGFVITFSAMASDFTTYYDPTVSGRRIFWYSYLGYTVPIILLECLGAAAVLAAPSMPTWNTEYRDGVDGDAVGLLEAMLSPVGNFGKFLTVMLSLSVTAEIAGTLYSMCFNFQVMIPALARVPRYVFSVVSTAIGIPLAIVGAHKFYAAFTNFLSLIGYWASAYGGIILVEHFYFRKSDFASYDMADWNVPKRLPWGAAAVTAGVLAFGLIIPCINQAWFVGPIGMQTGDIGFEVAFPLAGLLYVPLRTLELRYQKIN